MSKITIGIRVQISLEDVADLLDSASRGSSYWSENVNGLSYESNVKAILEQGEKRVIIDSEEDGRKYDLTLAKLKKGLTVMAKKEASHFADVIQGNSDQITADVFLQCSLFGEVKYS